jgi:hypothetical protein
VAEVRDEIRDYGADAGGTTRTVPEAP